jgi:hypothetical protein
VDAALQHFVEERLKTILLEVQLKLWLARDIAHLNCG